MSLQVERPISISGSLVSGNAGVERISPIAAFVESLAAVTNDVELVAAEARGTIGNVVGHMPESKEDGNKAVAPSTALAAANSMIARIDRAV